jgi:hypothetical protein
MKTYAGIGSRRTPDDVQSLMTAIATRLAQDDWVLRSGHADGADRAFEIGAGSKAEIYLPWTYFNQHVPIQGRRFATPTIEALDLAQHYHPAWHLCGSKARLLHARNMHQILGIQLTDPVKFVICWTPDGLDSGGTGQALRLARSRNIPIFNLQDQPSRSRLEKFVAPVNGLAVSR